ncbi:MAG: hypothetical protein R3E87_15070 [Burkholderiaceae bacterium]
MTKKADYTIYSPTGDAIKESIVNSGSSRAEMARMLYLSERTLGRYIAGEQLMHPAIWELWLIKSQSLRTQREAGVLPPRRRGKPRTARPETKWTPPRSVT